MPETTPDCYALPLDTRRFPVDRQGVYLQSAFSGKGAAVPSRVADALFEHPGFRSASDLAAAIEKAVPPGAMSVQHSARRVDELAEAGILVSRAQLLECCARFPVSTLPPPPISTVAIPTRQRPESLNRLLRSLFENRRTFGRTYEVVVADGAENASDARQTRDVLEEFQRTEQAPIAYAGYAERKRYAGQLAAESGVDREVIDFALLNPELCPINTGALRNALLFHGAGDTLLFADDDTIFKPWPSSRNLANAQLLTASTSHRIDALDPARGSESDPQPPPFDLAALHESVLGRRPGDLCSRGGQAQPLELGTVSHDLIRAAESGGKVRFSITGAQGDSGMGLDPQLCLGLMPPEASRDELIGSEATYRKFLGSRWLARSVERLTLSRSAFCMAMSMGVDASSSVPPFFPVQRNQDGLFAYLLRWFSPNAFAAYLPHTVWHTPPAPRDAGAGGFGALWENAGVLRVPDLIEALMDERRPSAAAAGSLETELSRLGALLADLADTTSSEFELTLKQAAVRRTSAKIGYCGHLLRKFNGTPAHWAADLSRYCDALSNRMSAADAHVPADLMTQSDPAGAVGKFKRLVGQWGRLLQVWPALIDGARRLKKKEIRIATVVGTGCLSGFDG